MNFRSSQLKSAISLPGFYLVLAAAAALFFIRFGEAQMLADSFSYLRYAELISNGQAFDLNKAADPFTILRTPGYPIFISLVRLFSNSLETLVLGHFVLGILSALFFAWALSPIAPAARTLLLVAFAWIGFREYFPIAITEWLSFCLLFFLAGSIFRTLAAGSLVWFTLSCLLLSFSAAVRPALIVGILLIPVLFYMLKIKLARLLLPTAIGLLPLAAVVGFNFARTGQAQLAAIDGLNLAGLTAICSEPNQPKSSLQKMLAEKRLPKELSVANIPYDKLEIYFTYNTWDLAYTASLTAAQPLTEVNRDFRDYGLAAIANKPDCYLSILARELAEYPLVFILSLALPLLLLIKRAAESVLQQTTLLLAILNLSYLAISSTLSLVTPRFFLLTGLPTLVLAALLIFKSKSERTSHDVQNR